MFFRKTIQKDISFEGIGLHTSDHSTVKLLPATEGTGVSVIIGNEKIPIDNTTLFGSSLGTDITSNGIKIRTVEHLLSAISGLGITDIQIIVNGNEIPILDGSAIDYHNGLLAVGIKTLGPYMKRKNILDFSVYHGSKYIRISPRKDKEITIEFSIKFENKIVSNMPQKLIYKHSESEYFNNIASARTFGFKRDLDSLLSENLCLGGSLENAILIDEDRIINTGGLRFSNEIVAHKVLDFVGDLSPLLKDYCGFHIEAHQGGHSINNKFLKAYFEKCKSIL